MDLRILFKLSLRTFRTRPARTVLTVLATGVGIGAILIFVSLGYGLQKTMLDQITTSESLLSLDATTPDSKVISLNQKIISDIYQIPNVEVVSPLSSLSGQLNLDSLTSDVIFYACSASYFKLGGVVVKSGNLFEKDDNYDIVVSSALLKSFNIEEKDALKKEAKITIFLTKEGEEGDQLETFEKENLYQISGIIDDDTTSFAYIPIGTLNNLGIDQYSQIKIKVTEAKFIEETKQKLVGMGLMISSLSETIDEANKIFGAIQIILGSFGVVALIVAAIGMANTMMVTLLERTNEIGIMKAIGGDNKDIAMMFLIESVVIGFLGGLSGIAINYLISGILNTGLNILARSLGGQPISLFYTPPFFIVFIIIFSIFVGIFSGIIPARRAAKLNPLEALRYK